MTTKETKAYQLPGCPNVTWTSPTEGVLRCPLACYLCATIWKEGGVWWIDINFSSGIISGQTGDVNNGSSTFEDIFESDDPDEFSSVEFRVE